MNLRGTSPVIALAVIIGGLVVLAASFVVEGQAFLWVGLAVGIAVGGIITFVSSRGDDSKPGTRR